MSERETLAWQKRLSELRIADRPAHFGNEMYARQETEFRLGWRAAKEDELSLSKRKDSAETVLAEKDKRESLPITFPTTVVEEGYQIRDVLLDVLDRIQHPSEPSRLLDKAITRMNDWLASVDSARVTLTADGGSMNFMKDLEKAGQEQRRREWDPSLLRERIAELERERDKYKAEVDRHVRNNLGLQDQHAAAQEELRSLIHAAKGVMEEIGARHWLERAKKVTGEK